MDKTRDVSAWEKRILRDENYEVGSTPNKPIKRSDGTISELKQADKELAKLLSEIAGESKLRGYEFKLFPRPKGPATKVIITQYDLPDPTAAPHSIAVRDGWVWSGNLSGPEVALLDSRTGEVTTFPVPAFRKGYPSASGDIEIDQEGNAWVSLRTMAGTGKVDRRTGKWTFYPIPRENLNERVRSSMVAPQSLKTRGIVWFKENNFNGIYMVDVKTGKVTSHHPFGKSASIMDRHEQTLIARGSLAPRPERGHRIYAMIADREGNGWTTDIEGGNIIKMDPTGKFTLYPTPTPDAGPRRGGFDERGRLWFSEYHASQVGMFDPATGQFQEWKVPKPSEHTYAVIPARNGEIWGAGQWNDYVFRFNPGTGAWTQYLLPTINTSIHKVVVDNSTTPVSVWIGETPHGKLTRLEALE